MKKQPIKPTTRSKQVYYKPASKNIDKTGGLPTPKKRGKK